MVFGNGRGGWRKLRGEELYDLFFYPNSSWAVKSWRMRWVGHVACNAYRVLRG
jgi:hypothetical protein